MRSKKIIAMLLLTSLTFSVVGCSDSNNTETKTTTGSEKATIETTSTEETSTAKESDSLIGESTSSVETTTSSEEATSITETETSNEETSSAPNKISQYYREDERNIAVYPEYSFVLEYKDLIIETLNGKVFHAGDIIDVKAELEKSSSL